MLFKLLFSRGWPAYAKGFGRQRKKARHLPAGRQVTGGSPLTLAETLLTPYRELSRQTCFGCSLRIASSNGKPSSVAHSVSRAQPANLLRLLTPYRELSRQTCFGCSLCPQARMGSHSRFRRPLCAI